MKKTEKAGIEEGKPRRANFSEEFKRCVIAESLEPGASVSETARRHNIHPNLVFKWRKRYRERGDGAPVADVEQVPLLPVDMIVEPIKEEARIDNRPASGSVKAGCEVEFKHARLRLHGPVEAAVLRLLIGELSK